MNFDKIKALMLSVDILENEADIYSKIIADNPSVEVRITGRQGTTGKTWLTRELKMLGVNAVDVYTSKSNPNTAYINIELNKPWDNYPRSTPWSGQIITRKYVKGAEPK